MARWGHQCCLASLVRFVELFQGCLGETFEAIWAAFGKGWVGARAVDALGLNIAGQLVGASEALGTVVGLCTDHAAGWRAAGMLAVAVLLAPVAAKRFPVGGLGFEAAVLGCDTGWGWAGERQVDCVGFLSRLSILGLLLVLLSYSC